MSFETWTEEGFKFETSVSTIIMFTVHVLLVYSDGIMFNDTILLNSSLKDITKGDAK